MNPLLNNSTFKEKSIEITNQHEDSSKLMTIGGTVGKTFFLLTLTILAAAYTWGSWANGYQQWATIYAFAGGMLGFILALATSFNPTWAPITAPIYAVCEGLALGSISAIYNERSHGIACQAAMLTFGTLAGMLFLFQANILRATPTFMKVIFGATLGIAITYLISIVLNLFHVTVLNNLIFGSSPISIAFSVFVVLVAAFNLIIDFEQIQQGNKIAPKYMEWYGGFCLLVTIVWLYIEFLRLLMKLNRR
jgi:uncharacterized YccA/Bax inhibitor family protein